MIDYIFFDIALRDKFVSYVEKRGVRYEAPEDNMGMVVAIPEDIPERVSDDIEDYYRTLEDEQEEQSETEGELNRLAGFNFTLPNGESRMLPLQIDMANRLMEIFTLKEIQELLNAVAECTLNPNDEHLCHILAAQKAQ
ncbi:hypothetical protein GALL_160480 [mine drainage metagenome]|uniref:Uncharacterized protein n=1 Tax=mine drainage metagenome TaxID=410659 RepID=A0A1J5S0P8_9ZZZZ